jgi:hypothetical protein
MVSTRLLRRPSKISVPTIFMGLLPPWQALIVAQDGQSFVNLGRRLAVSITFCGRLLPRIGQIRLIPAPVDPVPEFPAQITPEKLTFQEAGPIGRRTKTVPGTHRQPCCPAHFLPGQPLARGYLQVLRIVPVGV